MTKTELITEIQEQAWFGGLIGNLTLDQEWSAYAVKKYRAHVKVFKAGNVCSTVHIYFYVFDEGEPEEAAYYADLSLAEQSDPV